MITVVRTGPRALLVDGGRPGLAAIGVPCSGAFDRGAYEAGQALVGDRGGWAFEVLLGGLLLRTDAAIVVAVTGAPVSVTVDGEPAAAGLVALAAGGDLRLGAPRSGLRTYVAVAGGLVPPRPGALAGFGPVPLRAGDRVAVSPSSQPLPASLLAGPSGASPEPPDPAPVPSTSPAPVLPVLSVLPGPRFDHLARPAQLVGRWTVSPHSDRVGVRLDGGALDRTSPAEIESEGLVRGAVQAPPGGQLVVFGPDHPTTGGYPVIGVLTPDSLSVLAQARPGEQVRLEWR